MSLAVISIKQGHRIKGQKQSVNRTNLGVLYVQERRMIENESEDIKNSDHGDTIKIIPDS